ncbi:hypothetical protein GW7_03648 [Heterocephalus glaber]|uniref:Uncharacterized protein n=1 Tax=Heterocephalus glaber TaxID=10181 RepID=G5B1I7_HETGA|nr:hypothetical protein GW7_03648 [Heterocephalus glaber]
MWLRDHTFRGSGGPQAPYAPAEKQLSAALGTSTQGARHLGNDVSTSRPYATKTSVIGCNTSGPDPPSCHHLFAPADASEKVSCGAGRVTQCPPAVAGVPAFPVRLAHGNFRFALLFLGDPSVPPRGEWRSKSISVRESVSACGGTEAAS